MRTVRPADTRSRACCTSPSLSASSALVAWGTSGELPEIVRPYDRRQGTACGLRSCQQPAGPEHLHRNVCEEQHLIEEKDPWVA